MNAVAQRLVREPNALLGVVVALLGLLVLFHVPLSKEQIGGIVTLLGALVALVRQLVTPSVDVVARRAVLRRRMVADAGSGRTVTIPVVGAVAGPAADVPDGTPVTVAQHKP